MQRMYGGLLALLSGLYASGAQAHHSFAMFDSSKCFTLEGVVRKVEWNYPHVWLWLTPSATGANDSLWGFEAAAPQALLTRGLNQKTLAVGSRIVLTYRPIFSGENAGQLGAVILADGKQVVVQSGFPSSCPPAPVTAP